MGKRKISVEEFTNDVLSGMSDSDLMKKHRVSRRNLDGMLAKLLERGELKPSDLGDTTQKALEPTLELAVTCPQCGALNLFGAAQCPECGHSRVTRDFQAMDTQDASPVPSEPSTETPQDEPETGDGPQTSSSLLESRLPGDDLVELEGLEDLRRDDATVDIKDYTLVEESRPAPPPTPARSRKAFLYIAVVALLIVAGGAGAGLYMGMIRLPFGSDAPPPVAVQKPPQPSVSPGPQPKRTAATSPKPAAQAPKAAPTEPVKESPPPVPEKAPTLPVVSPEPTEEPKNMAREDTQVRTPEQAKPVPQLSESPRPPVADEPKPPAPTKIEEPGPLPANPQEPAQEVAKPEPVDRPGKRREEKTSEVALVPPAAEPDRGFPVVKPESTRVPDIPLPDAAPPGTGSVTEKPRAEPVTPPEQEPIPQRHAALQRPLGIRHEPSARPKGDMGPLVIDAIKKRDQDMLKVLLDGGADPDTTDAEGATALMYAARTRCLSCVATLLQRGADVQRADKSGATALDMARRAGRTRAAELILARDPEKGPAALLIACQEGLSDMVQVLVENGVDVNSTDKNGNTALMVAAEKGNLAIVSMLLNKGADARARNKQGQTALSILSHTGSSTGRVPSRVRKELVRMLGQQAIREDEPRRSGR
jgi:hypothetical protein